MCKAVAHCDVAQVLPQYLVIQAIYELGGPDGIYGQSPESLLHDYRAPTYINTLKSLKDDNDDSLKRCTRLCP
jgi:hypothetical protein